LVQAKDGLNKPKVGMWIGKKACFSVIAARFIEK
jgi:hypothetical protein